MKKDYRFRKVPRSVSLEYGISMALEQIRDKGLDPTVVINNTLRDMLQSQHTAIYEEIYGEPEEHPPVSKSPHRAPRKAGLRK